MKQLTRVSFFALLVFLLASCQNKEVISEISQQQNTPPSAPIYTLNITDGQPALVALQKEDLQLANSSKASVTKSYKNSNGPATNHSAHGIINTSSPNTLVFSAVEDQNGIHGENYLDGKNFKNVKFNTECLLVDGNEAYFGGTITSWELGEEILNGAGQVSAGWEIYVPVQDNGEGANANDAFGSMLLFVPPGITFAEIEIALGLPSGALATNGVSSMCEMAAFLYQLGDPNIVFVPGEKPTNVQVK